MKVIATSGAPGITLTVKTSYGTEGNLYFSLSEAREFRESLNAAISEAEQKCAAEIKHR